MPKFIDLTGKKFGRLTVIERAEDYVSPKGSCHTQWKCLCDCGNITVVDTRALKTGNTQSCGCIRNEYRNSPTKDLTGNKFGLLTVIQYAGKSAWLCRCDCGNEKVVKTDKLKSGHTKSCGCLNHKATTTIDLTGKTFGKWIVLRQDPIKRHGGHAKWICRCECGTVASIDSGNLRTGGSQMCRNCYANVCGEALIQDISGKRFGKLVAIKIDHRNKNETYWKCQCDCGQTPIVTIHALNSGNTRSCGCWHRSKYEDWTMSYLENTGCFYRTQIKYNDLTGINQKPLSYDFGIYDEKEEHLLCLIECQGQQHYKPVDLFGGEEQFEIQQFHDELKREYASNIGAPLIEIPYTEDTYEKVERFLDNALERLLNKQ